MTELLIRLFIKDRENVSAPSVRTAYGTLGAVTGIVCNIFLFAVKLSAGLLSGSLAVIADAFNNFSDVGSCVISLLGFKLSSKPADRRHPFGHGRFEYIFSALISIFIIIVGIELLVSSVKKMFAPEPLEIGWPVILILVAAVAVKLWMTFMFRRLGRSINSVALKASSKDSLTDCVATSAVLISTIVSALFGVNIDPYAGTAVSAFIIFTGVRTMREALDPLLGSPADRETLDAIKDLVREFPEFIGAHDLIVHNYGPGRRFASLHVEVPYDIDILHAHEQIDLCEKAIEERLGLKTVIHMDPVITDNDRMNDIKAKLCAAISSFDPALKIHDFHASEHSGATGISFDLAVPEKYPIPNDELVQKISELARGIDENLNCDITVDIDFSGGQ